MTALRGRIVIAGGTGFLGRSLAAHLTKLGCEVIVLGRHAPRDPIGQFVPWDGCSLGPWTDALRDARAIVNLAGRSVDCRKTPAQKAEILRSRVDSTTVLGRALADSPQPPPVWVQMSTAHIYGDPAEQVCDEHSPFGVGLAPDVGRAWETAHTEALPAATRGVVLRTSFVLGRAGGALPTLARLVRWRLGGRIGHGRQGISWLHERDMNGLFERAIVDESMHGAYLATAPQPVSNAEFMRELRRALGVRVGLPAARWMVRLGAPLLGTDPELAILGRYCRSRRLVDEGFAFAFPELRAALADLFG